MIYLNIDQHREKVFGFLPIDTHPRYVKAVRQDMLPWMKDQRIYPQIFVVAYDDNYDEYYHYVGNLDNISYNAVRGLIGIHLGFETPEDAMLFKLTWL